ncbi:MAG: abortive phage infection protein [Bulleidia sp.]
MWRKTGGFPQEEALYHPDLADRETVKHILTIYTGANTKRLTVSVCKVCTVKREHLEVGKINMTDSYGMRDPERTTSDVVRSRRNIEAQDFTQALNPYTEKKDLDPNRLMANAAIFYADRMIRTYMEVLLSCG